jgi:hypothetical protein
MKKLLLLFVVLNSFLPVFAQPSNAGDEVALNLVRAHANQLQLSKEDLQNLSGICYLSDKRRYQDGLPATDLQKHSCI